MLLATTLKAHRGFYSGVFNLQVSVNSPFAAVAWQTRPSPAGESDSAHEATTVDDAAQVADARELAALQARDREVRNHELAHQAAGGAFVTGGIQFSYQRGSDGRYYAVGGEVSISTAAVAGDPAATLRKMAVVRRAATAPADPSAQDLKVAAQAAAAASQAAAELMQQRQAAEKTESITANNDSTAEQRAYQANGPGQDAPRPVLDLLA